MENESNATIARPEIGIIVPMFNEEDGLDLFFARLEPVLKSLTSSYEIVCVDDGSTDGTLSVLLNKRAEDLRIKVVGLSRNFGKDVALSAGLEHSTAQSVVPMDADLQDPPELIPVLWERKKAGFDVVLAIRTRRDTDTWLKRRTANAFYRLHNRIADIIIPENAGDFRMMDYRVVEVLKRLPERTRFMKGLFAWVGFSHSIVEYERQSRAVGKSKFGWWKLWNFALDGITASSSLPLRIWTYSGGLISVIAILFAIWILVDTLINGNAVQGYASLMVGVLGLGGLNILATGILGEYLSRVYTEVRARPLYVVRESYGASNGGEVKWNEVSFSDSTPLKANTGGSERAAPF